MASQGSGSEPAGTVERVDRVDRVERSVEIDAGTDEVWRHVADPDELARWLGERVDLDLQPGGCGHVVDDDGVRREVLVTAVEPGRRLAWHWWADGGELSSVEITLVPVPAGTRVDVVEIAAGAPAGGAWARACASAVRLGSRVPA